MSGRRTIIDSASPLAWRRDRDAGWCLFANRRRMGRVARDEKHRGMFRSPKTFGRLSDMANLSHAKNAVLVAAELELEFEAKLARPSVSPAPARDPRICPEKRGVFSGPSSPVRQNRRAGPLQPPARKAAP
jgi:hypothetical protein